MQFSHLANRKRFAFGLIIVEILIFIMYSVFVRHQVHNNPALAANYYPLYQDINVMMLIGFGFLMSFIRKYAWSALSYTFFINSVAVQLYILISSFWARVFSGWSQKYIQINERSFISASICVASILIAFGAILGRVGPLQLLIMSIVQVIGYSLNEYIVFDVIQMLDAGGSTVIHAFGAYFGITVSYILGKTLAPRQRPKITYISNVFAMLGTFFLWLFWPSFNAGIAPQTPYHRSIIIVNTILALTASNLACYTITSLLKEKFYIDHIENATLAGGVIIGASCGIFTNPGASLIIGAFGGVVSSLSFSYLQDVLKDKFGIYDTCGVHNLHGIPGVLGGLISAIAIAVYKSDPLTDPLQESYLPFYTNLPHGRSFGQQGAIQVAGTIISLCMGIGFGIIAGLIISTFYTTYLPHQFYNDHYHFSQMDLQNQVGPRSSPLVRLPTQIRLMGQDGPQSSRPQRSGPQSSGPQSSGPQSSGPQNNLRRF